MLDFVHFLQNYKHAFLGPGFATSHNNPNGLLLSDRTRIDTLSLAQLHSTQHTSALEKLLRKLDSEWPKLNAEEALFFYVGYDAAATLHGLKTRTDLRDHDYGPDAFIERVVVGPSSKIEVPALSFAPKLTIDKDAQQEHQLAVETLKNEIAQGVTYQANLAHAIKVERASRKEAARFFAHAKRPSFSAFVTLEGFGDLVSLSPECFLTFSMHKKDARAKPIKGTRARSQNPLEDRALFNALVTSSKDCAEHDMIVDLLRNDLGMVSDRVEVESLRDVVSVENVHHLESTLRAELCRQTRFSDLLIATLPAGSITGAPKSTAVEQIALLEKQKRGPYTGILGLIDSKGEGAASILIRTWIRPDEREGTLHSGGGIVWDSNAQSEWQETLDKARAFASL